MTVRLVIKGGGSVAAERRCSLASSRKEPKLERWWVWRLKVEKETNNSKLITKYVEVFTGATFAVMFDVKPGFCATGDYYLQLNIQFDGKCQSRPIISKEGGTNRCGYYVAYLGPSSGIGSKWNL
jgi:hypothetical protein